MAYAVLNKQTVLNLSFTTNIDIYVKAFFYYLFNSYYRIMPLHQPSLPQADK